MATKVHNMGAVLTLYFSYLVYAMGLIAASQLAGSPGDGWGLSAAWGSRRRM